jgi:hypothetical protein
MKRYMDDGTEHHAYHADSGQVRVAVESKAPYTRSLRPHTLGAYGLMHSLGIWQTAPKHIMPTLGRRLPARHELTKPLCC